MSSTIWTAEERSKAEYIARRAVRRGRDPVADIVLYMGMDRITATLAARRGAEQVRGEYRRRPVRIRRGLATA